MKRRAIQPLTSFRFFAALAVFVYHLPDFSSAERNMWLRQGYTGVTFFFILSGFILSYTYAERMAKPDRNSILAFYITRFARIYPSHILTFFLSMPLYLTDYSIYGIRRLLSQAAAQVLVIQSFFAKKHIFFSYNMVSWSLSVEFFFYALFPFLLVGCLRLKPALGRWATVLLWGCAVGLVALYSPRLSKDEAYWLFGVFPPFRTVDFVIGILLYTAFTRPEASHWSHAKHNALEISSLALLAGAYFMSPLLPEPFYWGTYYLPFMAYVIWVFSFSQGYLAKLFSSRWLVYLGELSFGFYMYHHLVIWGLERSGWPFLDQAHPLITSSIAFAGALSASALSYNLVEVPAKKMICERFIPPSALASR